MAGFGRYMTLLALIAEKRRDGKEVYTFSKKYLAKKLSTQPSKVEKFLESLSETFGIVLESFPETFQIKYSKFAELNPYLCSKKKKKKEEEEEEYIREISDFEEGEESEKKKPIKIKKDPPFKNEAQEVLEYLNTKAGKRFTFATNKKFIIGRLKENHSVEEMKAVIDRKLKNDFFLSDNKKFMRPSTLFSKTNFENYVNEVSSSKPKADVFLAE